MTTQPIRIMHVVDSLEVGGLERLVEELVRNRRDPFEHQVCAIRARGEIGARMLDRGCAIHLLGRSEGPDRTVIPRLAGLLRRQSATIVHAHSDGARDALPAARLIGVASVYTQHGWLTAEHRRRDVWLDRLFLKAANRVIAVSRHSADYLHRVAWVAEHKLRLIRNAVPSIEATSQTQRDRARKTLHIDRDAAVVGTVAAMRPVKRLQALLGALPLLLERRPNLVLLLVGDGPERGALESEARRLRVSDHVLIVGRRDDVREYLAAMDVFALSSDIEGTSLALMEACWRALPVVATDTGGNREVVESGTSGTLVPPADPAAIADALASYLLDRDKAARHGAAARARMQARYSFAELLDRHDALYQELIGRR